MKKFYSLLGLIFFVIIVNAQNPLLYALTSAGGASGKRKGEPLNGGEGQPLAKKAAVHTAELPPLA